MLFFKRKKEEEEQLGNIFCELIWDKNIKDKIELIGTNLLTDQRVLCAANVYEKQSYYSTRPSANIYIPRIVYEIDWKFIFKSSFSAIANIGGRHGTIRVSVLSPFIKAGRNLFSIILFCKVLNLLLHIFLQF